MKLGSDASVSDESRIAGSCLCRQVAFSGAHRAAFRRVSARGGLTGYLAIVSKSPLQPQWPSMSRNASMKAMGWSRNTWWAAPGMAVKGAPRGATY